MSALMKTRHTENTTEIFVSLPTADDGSLSKVIVKKLEAMGHSVRQLNDDGEELLSIEELFPEGHPGMVIRGLRTMEDMTQQELADRLGIAQTRVSEMESGKRTISVKMSKNLATIFSTSYKAFL